MNKLLSGPCAPHPGVLKCRCWYATCIASDKWMWHERQANKGAYMSIVSLSNPSSSVSNPFTRSNAAAYNLEIHMRQRTKSWHSWINKVLCSVSQGMVLQLLQNARLNLTYESEFRMRYMLQNVRYLHLFTDIIKSLRGTYTLSKCIIFSPENSWLTFYELQLAKALFKSWKWI